MAIEFEDIIITGKPDPKKVHLGYSDRIYIFPFPISNTPTAEWIEIFYSEWWASDQTDGLSEESVIRRAPKPIPAMPPNGSPKQKHEAEVKESSILLESSLEELSNLSKRLIEIVDSTNRRCKEILQQQEASTLAEQRAIQEAIDKIKLS